MPIPAASRRCSLVVACLFAAACSGPQPQSADPAHAERLLALRAAGRSAPLTLSPVRLLGRPEARVAEALGLVLEQAGMNDLAVAGHAFDSGGAP
jgi:hypothetical protein